jgi:hypothetical protein
MIRKDFKKLKEDEVIKTLIDVFGFKNNEVIESLDNLKKTSRQVIIKNKISEVALNFIKINETYSYTLWGKISKSCVKE